MDKASVIDNLIQLQRTTIVKRSSFKELRYHAWLISRDLH